MERIEKITINGQTYAVADQRISDGPMGETVWTSERLISGLLPRVVCQGHTVAGDFLPNSSVTLTAEFAPVQAGSGVASPDNIRPITGLTALSLHLAGQDRTVDFGQQIMGGIYDWTSGQLTVQWKAVQLKDLTWGKWDASATEKNIFSTSDLLGIARYVPNTTAPIGAASMYTGASMNNLLLDRYDMVYSLGLNQKGVLVVTDSRFDTLEEFLENMGQCVFVYQLVTPQVIQLEGQPLIAQGELEASCQDAVLVLEGYAHGSQLLTELSQRVAALEKQKLEV